MRLYAIYICMCTLSMPYVSIWYMQLYSDDYCRASIKRVGVYGA